MARKLHGRGGFQAGVGGRGRACDSQQRIGRRSPKPRASGRYRPHQRIAFGKFNQLPAGSGFYGLTDNKFRHKVPVGPRKREIHMYIGGGILGTILLIVLIVYLIRRA
jgi:hypothetical protein